VRADAIAGAGVIVSSSPPEFVALQALYQVHSCAVADENDISPPMFPPVSAHK